MRIFQRSQFPMIWLACLALLVHAFLPLLVNSMGNAASANRGGIIEICSTQGVKRIDRATGKLLSVAALKATQEKQHVNGHCAFCLPHADHDFLLPLFVSDMEKNELNTGLPLLFYQARHSFFIWGSAQARAPPAFG